MAQQYASNMYILIMLNALCRILSGDTLYVAIDDDACDDGVDSFIRSTSILSETEFHNRAAKEDGFRGSLFSGKGSAVPADIVDLCSDKNDELEILHEISSDGYEDHSKMRKRQKIEYNNEVGNIIIFLLWIHQ